MEEKEAAAAGAEAEVENPNMENGSYEEAIISLPITMIIVGGGGRGETTTITNKIQIKE